MKRIALIALLLLMLPAGAGATATAKSFTSLIYDPGKLKPIDSTLKIAPGDKAPDFTLRSVKGDTVTLSSYRHKQNVVISFVPAAWTPVCSDQWPGYNIAKTFFTKHDAVLLGITVDNIPTLHAWTQQMGELWFDVLSDFWPHGAVAESYGVLRSDGTSERALIFIDREGMINSVHISDINIRPSLETVVAGLENLDKGR
ncbi:peroxiredoxin [Desulfopila aestuarii]|uniref:Peroxiredoxin (Alkyl hydroperoxide reductase subunit C) n=1 Tax=Desulfopila aestuarii DSM 18488 TaxID=1121416 RepID=A0A1M7Y818_9BACT|nr:peroxiredoxin [Desulfopila aestuarii]SHO48678.1 peroxiredoxin (alkyl hydroperoxide reductase subunit C) [Desulfopila aestuarii DSM 18488]